MTGLIILAAAVYLASAMANWLVQSMYSERDETDWRLVFTPVLNTIVVVRTLAPELLRLHGRNDLTPKEEMDRLDALRNQLPHVPRPPAR